jgi:hypothetical protein
MNEVFPKQMESLLSQLIECLTKAQGDYSIAVYRNHGADTYRAEVTVNAFPIKVGSHE